MLKDWKYGIISLGLFLLLLGVSAFLYSPESTDQGLTLVEQPLVKKQAFSLLPGEKYTYRYKFGNNSMDVVYVISGGKNCTIISIVNASQQTGCINDKGNDKNMSNLSLAMPFLPIFKPWMLAVEDRWHWGAVAKGNITGIEQVFDELNLTTIGQESFRGRIAYKVRLDETNSPSVYFLIDKEKKVLLREFNQNYEIILIQAPFSFEQ